MRLAPDLSAITATQWVALRVEAPEGPVRDRAVQMLVEGGAGAVQEVGSALLTHMPESTELHALCDALAEAGVEVERTTVGEVDWSTRWITRVGVQRIGRIAVAPPWMSADWIAPGDWRRPPPHGVQRRETGARRPPPAGFPASGRLYAAAAIWARTPG